MNKLFLLLILVSGAATSFAQTLEETERILDKPQGEALFSLNMGERVYSYEPESGWYKIRKEVYLDPAEVVDDKYALANAKLLNKNDEAIGSVLKETKLKEGKLEKGFRGKDRFHAVVEGFVFKTKFADKSIPEEKVNELLAAKNRNEQVQGFEEFFKEHSAEKRKFEELTAYVLYEENKTPDVEKDFRLIVIFRGESTPYAIISNGHPSVTAPKIKQEWEQDSFKVLYLYKPTSAQEKLIQDDILYTFLAL